ncbi:CotH kinase family protein [Mucilaginibacter sp. dw_454]|uniref:CotH kinase family protein n=1 Tax=Mucilaginibacter sp. dw_454 TaxID=2720079 RepID=UPI001BD409C4|nr:CotH kinase family protein [Mucilaginibacter sp. dw_454]
MSISLLLRQAKSYAQVIAIALALAASASCKKDQNKIKTTAPAAVLSSDKEITSFIFKVAYNHVFTDDVVGEIKGDTIYAPVFASTANVNALIPQFSFTGAQVTINGTIQESNITTNNFTTPLTYTVTAADKSSRSYVVKVTDNGISSIYITTDGGAAITSKDDYITGTVKVVSNFTKVGYNGKTQIKGHGNSTWFDMPKKPYKLKLDKKTSMLGMPEGKNWILLANYADKSLMRNELAFTLSRTFGRQFTPASRFVELYLNGEYRGNYQITQEVKQGPGLVDVEDQDATTTTLPDLSGGYMIEEDLFANGSPVYFYTTRQMGFDIEYPDDDVINQQQKDYISNHFQKLEDAMFADNFADPTNGYCKYFDVDTYVDYYLVSEIIGNPDVFRSTYLFKKRNDDHIYTGPNWDYDKAANNDNRLGDQVNGLMLTSAFGPQTWINRLMLDQTFRQKIRSRWNQMKGKVSTLPTVVDALANQLAVSEVKNFTKWQIIGHQSYLEVYVGMSYQDEVNYLKTFLTAHIAWLDQKFNSADYQ